MLSCKAPRLSFVFLKSLWGWTSSGGWQPGLTVWRAWIFTQQSHGCWPVCTMEVSACGITKHRYDLRSMYKTWIVTRAPDIRINAYCFWQETWCSHTSPSDSSSCCFRPLSRRLRCVISLLELLSLWQGRTGSSLARWGFHVVFEDRTSLN